MTYSKVVTQLQQALLRRKKVQELTGLSRSGLYLAIKNGVFPRPVKIGLRAVAWKATDIYTWIESKIIGAKK